jgi:hypothetical protein
MGVVLGSRRSRRAAAAVGTSLAVLTVGVGWPSGAVGAAPTQAVEACPEAFPVADLTVGQVGEGLTVETGTTPDPFTATVLGVLDDGIAPGLDMILVEADSPALQRAGGVWGGMSGSPVYAADGRLIGAIAYGLAGASTIAGITPAADMYTLLDRPGSAPVAAAEIDLPADLERRVVASGAATAAEAAAGMQQLPIPLGVSGVGQGRIDEVAERLAERFPGARVYAAGAAGVGETASPDEIFPGSNYAAAFAYGDVTLGGVGTTTAVCTVGSNTYALAFGHPFAFLGATAASTHVADAVTVQPDPIFGPFKVANLGGVAGTTDQDRLAGIRGLLGPAPATMPITSTITSNDDGSSRTGATQVNVQDFAPDAVFSHVLANLDRVADRIGGGSAQLRWVIRGTRASGAPFTVDVTNRYADAGDATILPAIDVADQVFFLATNEFEDAEVTSVDVTGSVSSTVSQYTIDSVRIRKPTGGSVLLPPDEPIRAVAGSRLNLRVVLRPFRGIGPNKNVDVSIVIPPDTAGDSGEVDVVGGPELLLQPEPTSFTQLLQQLRGVTPNNAVTASLSLEGRRSNYPGARTRVLADAVVVGDTSLDIDVISPRGGKPAVVTGATWRLRSSLSTGPATSTFTFGTTNDIEVMGDWDGNGSSTPAVFRSGIWSVRPSDGFAPANFGFGQAGDVPVVGDWDGDGDDSIGVYRAGRWLLRNSVGFGPADLDFRFGGAGHRPVTGDWDGDGDDSVGVYNPGSGAWNLRFTNSAGGTDRGLQFGRSGDVPVVGEWDGDGRDEVGVYRSGQWLLNRDLFSGNILRTFSFGSATGRPLVWG